MVFSESLKLEVKKKAHFKCCVCESFSPLEIHHIIPQSEEGSDTIENAAPLCTKCHDIYGANPEKRKWVREKRNFWLEHCEKKLYNEDINQLEKTHEILEKIHKDQENRLKYAEEKISFLQTTVENLTQQNKELVSRIPETPVERKDELFAQIGSTSGTITASSIAMTQLGRGVYANPSCHNCGSQIGLYVSNASEPPRCPNCNNLMQ